MVPSALQAAQATKQTNGHAQLFADETISFEAMRALGYASVGGADVMEVLQALDGVDEAKPETWYTSWHNLALQVQGWGDKSVEKGHGVSAAQAYLRASMYHRSAGFFLTITPKDPRNNECYDQSVACFRRAIKWLTPRVEAVHIPYQGRSLPGYYMRSEGGGRRPLAILHTGFDGTAEEMYFTAVALIKRGYSCLIFDGPGQGGALRNQRFHFRPDWETPVKAVIDFAEKLPDASLDRLALLGYSFGGYLAPRAAAYDHRIKLCVANGGVWDMFDVIAQRFPKDLLGLMDSDPALFDKYFIEGVSTNLGSKWGLYNGLYTFGASTPSEWMKMLRSYNLREAAPLIEAETLVIDTEDDTMMPNQAKPLFDAIKAPKTFMEFSKAEGAQLHCQVGAQLRSAQRICDWLDERR
jgi:alpha-beta hydrolase superfamily lysophospholipase